MTYSVVNGKLMVDGPCARIEVLPRDARDTLNTMARDNEQLRAALRAIVKITDGSQPIDYPGALMVARSALGVQS